MQLRRGGALYRNSGTPDSPVTVMDPETVKTAIEVAVASRLLGSASESSIRGI